MTKTEIYNADYTKVNHAYIEIFDFYTKLIECDDADEEILLVLENILRVFNPALDKIKSEMTVKTRYKEEPAEKKGKSPQVIKANFTGE